MSAIQKPKRMPHEESYFFSDSQSNEENVIGNLNPGQITSVVDDVAEDEFLEEFSLGKRQKVDHRSEVESFAINHIRCETSQQDLDKLKEMYCIPNSIDLRISSKNSTPNRPLLEYVTLYL